MTYRAHVKNGQITLDEPADLPEGAEVAVELVQEQIEYPGGRITRPKNRKPLQRITPIEMPGGPLSDELIRDRR
jgi:hypothetical protein